MLWPAVTEADVYSDKKPTGMACGDKDPCGYRGNEKEADGIAAAYRRESK